MNRLRSVLSTLRAFVAAHPSGVALLCICLVSFLTYAPLFYGTFLNFDDGQQIFNNLRIKEGGLGNFEDALFTNYTGKGSAPSFAVSVINWAITPNYAGFAALNLIAFMGVILIFYRFTALFLGDRRARLAATLLFSVHSLNTDTLGWMSSRCHIIGGTFVLCSMIFWQKYLDDTTRARRLFWYAFAVWSAAVAIWNKGIFLVLPGLIVVYEVYRSRRFCLPAVLDKIPLLALAVLPFLFAPLKIGAGRFDKPGLGATLPVTLMNDAGLVMEYLYHLAVPGPTAVSIDVYPVTSLLDASDASSLLFMRLPPISNIALLVLLGAIAVLFLVRYRSKHLFFFFAFTAVGLSPVMNIPPRWVDFAFRFEIMPLFFFCVLVGAALAAVLPRLGRRGAYAAIAVFCLYAFWHAAAGFMQARAWDTELGYWTACTEHYPDSIVCRYKAAWLSGREQRMEDTERHHRQVFQYSMYRAPNRPRPAAKNLGGIYRRMGRTEEAIFYLQMSLGTDRLNAADRKWVHDALRELKTEGRKKKP